MNTKQEKLYPVYCRIDEKMTYYIAYVFGNYHIFGTDDNKNGFGSFAKYKTLKGASDYLRKCVEINGKNGNDCMYLVESVLKTQGVWKYV